MVLAVLNGAGRGGAGFVLLLTANRQVRGPRADYRAGKRRDWRPAALFSADFCQGAARQGRDRGKKVLLVHP